MRNSRILVFVAIAIGLAAFVAFYLRQAATRLPSRPAATQTSPAPSSTESAPEEAPQQTIEPSVQDAPASAAVEAEPVAAPAPVAYTPDVFFRHTGVDSHYGMLARTRVGRLNEVTYIDKLQCEVVHVSGGKGICLTADRGVFTTYAALLFDANTYQVTANIPLNGIASRCRMSIDGKLAALTVFVSGHGYSTLDFSTQTLLIDVESGKVLADLEKDFVITRDGAKFSNPDFNFWGVTFTSDVKHFYATLSTEGKHFLIRGNIADRMGAVLHENVECPSVSPDDARVAYKKRFIVNNRIVWQLHVLDLQTRKETALSEKRSIDDQLEWLGAENVLYSVPAGDASGASTEVWIAPADGKAAPKLFLPNAYSPAVVRHASTRGE